mmetsp:Transcript_409/g.1420  ORF Transcript_409/g.1420 Transcript_409/m.1420 type:complete len:352 (-) Transcript_409:917-1972(-)
MRAHGRRVVGRRRPQFPSRRRVNQTRRPRREEHGAARHRTRKRAGAVNLKRAHHAANVAPPFPVPLEQGVRGVGGYIPVHVSRAIAWFLALVKSRSPSSFLPGRFCFVFFVVIVIAVHARPNDPLRVIRLRPLARLFVQQLLPGFLVVHEKRGTPGVRFEGLVRKRLRRLKRRRVLNYFDGAVAVASRATPIAFVIRYVKRPRELQGHVRERRAPRRAPHRLARKRVLPRLRVRKRVHLTKNRVVNLEAADVEPRVVVGEVPRRRALREKIQGFLPLRMRQPRGWAFTHRRPSRLARLRRRGFAHVLVQNVFALRQRFGVGKRVGRVQQGLFIFVVAIHELGDFVELRVHV